VSNDKKVNIFFSKAGSPLPKFSHIKHLDKTPIGSPSVWVQIQNGLGKSVIFKEYLSITEQQCNISKSHK